MVMSKRSKLISEKVCTKCNGNGVIIDGTDGEWSGSREELCSSCMGSGSFSSKKSLEINGYRIASIIPDAIDGFYIKDGCFAQLYVKKGPKFFHWANWSVGTIQKVEEDEIYCYSEVELLDKLEDGIGLMIQMFYESSEQDLYCEYNENDGNPYSELEPGSEEKWENYFSNIFNN